MENQDFFKKLISSINKNKTIAANKLIGQNPNIATVVSKLINPKTMGYKTLYDTANLSNTLNTGKLTSISNSISSRYLDNKNMLQLFPDLELAMQILVSSILSPKDMVKTELIYKTKEIIFPIELNTQILEEVKTYLNTNYEINSSMSDLLEESLFIKGASVKAVLPESLIDAVINNSINNKSSGVKVSQEVFNEIYTKVSGEVTLKPMGILGSYSNKNKVTLESFNEYSHRSVDIGLYIDPNDPKLIDPNIEISDNFSLLKLPLATNKVRSNLIKSKYMTNPVTENVNVQDITSLLFKTSNTETKLVEVLPNAYNLPRKSVGKPLLLNLPSESVIPISLPNEPHNHLGYFVVVDENGNPVSTGQTDLSQLNSLLNTNGSQNNLSSHLLQRANSNIRGNDSSNNLRLDNITHIYANLVEDNLKNRLANGLYHSSVNISNDTEIYKIMLARSLANKYTKVIYIPEEFVTYFAFDFYENGVGKSLLDNLKIITSLRAMLMFSRTMAHLKSSINITTVGLTLDEHDPDPQKTVEIAIHEVLRMRQQYFPLGINSAPDLVDWIQRAGIEFSFEGHPGLPNTKFDFDIKNLQHTIPPTDFDDELRKQTYMALGLSPEVVDNGFNPEFATSVVSNNILLSKRVIIYQTKFLKLLKSHINKILTFDDAVRKNIFEIIKNNLTAFQKYLTDEDKISFKDNELGIINKYINMFFEQLELELPKPDETTIENQLTSYDKYTEALDKVIDHWISSEIAGESLVGELSSHIDSVKNIVKSYFIRRWMSDNNFMPEISELVTTDIEGNPNIDLFSISKSHIISLMKSSFKLIKSMQENKNIMDKNLETIGAEEPEVSEDTESSEESSEFDDNESFGEPEEEESEEEEPEEKPEEEESEEKPEEKLDEESEKEPEEEPEK